LKRQRAQSDENANDFAFSHLGVENL